MNDIEVVQWFFDLEAITREFNWPVSVDGMAAGKRALDSAISGKSPASDVKAAYDKFAGAIGPEATKALLGSDDAFPEVNHSGKETRPLSPVTDQNPTPERVVLYVDTKGQRVVAEWTKQWGMPPKFHVE